MHLDPTTLFVVLLAATLTCAVLLLWSWRQSPGERSLLWMGVGYALAAAGNLLFGGRDRLPDVLSIDLANALMLCGFVSAWVTGRVFNGRNVPVWIALAGPLLWLAACRIPAFYTFEGGRVALLALLTIPYVLMAAREFLRGGELKSRYPLAMLLVCHSLVLVARIPIALSGGTLSAAPFASPWFAPMAIEAVVFIQALALLSLSLVKERAEASVRRVAQTDSLTGLATRRAFLERGASAIEAGLRHGRPTSLVLFDLDRFKAINDTYGHPVGDAVLEAFAAAARTAIREIDCAGRLGGEEFAALLVDADEAGARAATERIMATFNRLVRADDSGISCTTSAGVAVSSPGRHSIDALMLAADSALYEAKRSGGNQLRVADRAAA